MNFLGRSVANQKLFITLAQHSDAFLGALG